MSITLGVMISILAPTVFFLVTYIWANLINRDLSFQVRRTAGVQAHTDANAILAWLVTQHHLKSIFAEATLLFAVNGLIITFELDDAVAGSVLMIAGILLSVSALIYMYVHEEPASFPEPPFWFPVLLVSVFAFAIAEFSYIATYAFTTPTVSALLSSGIGIVSEIAIYEFYYKKEFRFVHVGP